MTIEILESQVDGISEHELIKEYAIRGFSAFNYKEFKLDLSLFQMHFTLFHLLYHLRDLLLKERKYILSIHCLKIKLYPYHNSSTNQQPDLTDPLRDYYLDLSNLEQTDETSFNKMMNNFWQQYEFHDKRESALTTLGLTNEASYHKIKKRYHQLALQYHPDLGGDQEKFRLINNAMEILMNGYKLSQK